MKVQALYSIETNLEFNHRVSSAGKVPHSVLESYKLPVPDKIRVIEKHNRFSDIFVFEIDSKRVVVRSTSATSAKLLELQCRVFSWLPSDFGLKPLYNTEGNFVTCENDLAWIAYPYIEGPLFEGDSDQVLIAFQRCLEVAEQFESIGNRLSAEEKRLFPQVKFDSSAWKSAVSNLIIEVPEPVLVALGSDLQSFFVQNRTRLLSLVDELSTWPLPPAALVHYDLQHANIVMSEPGPTIIDLEDIYFAPKQIAISYCAFKLSRHVVFNNQGLVSWVIAELIPEMTAMLKSCGVDGREELFGLATIRNLNDLAYINHLYYDRGMDFVLYDLRKKVLNVLECAELAGCSGRVGLK